MQRRNRHADRDDLIQDGWFGLRDAALKFEPERGLKFATYAARRITGAMLDGIRERDHAPRLMRQRGTAPLLKSLAGKVRGDEKKSLGDTLADADAGRPADLFDRREWLTRLLAGLSRSERLIIQLYYVVGMTMKEAGIAIGLSESRVTQMHTSILMRLRATRQRDDEGGTVPC